MKRRHGVLLMMLCSLFILFGCSGGDSSSGPADTGSGTGTLAVSLTDAPAGGLKAVYVTIEEISVCAEATEADTDADVNAAAESCLWEVIDTPGSTYNLLELVNGVTETLAVAELPVGTYHQMRLLVGSEADDGTNISGKSHPHPNYLIDAFGKAHPLKIPSGLQSGIKLESEFEIEENKYTEIILDFDAARSIVAHGNKDTYSLKPAIRVIDPKQMTRLVGAVSMVNTDSSEIPLESVHVSAQRVDGSSGLVVDAHTLTDAAGGYQLLLGKNREYTIVVFSNAHIPACDLIANYGEIPEEITRNFVLDASDSRRITGSITGTAAGSDVVLSIRQVGQGCGNGDQEIELLRQTIAYDEGGIAYDVTLPVDMEYKISYTDGVNESSRMLNVEPDTASQTLQPRSESP